MATLTSSTCSLLPTSPSKSQVFLSFAEETRKNFTSFLYKKLRDKGISTFLKEASPISTTWEDISPEVSRAIEESHISVVIFSPNYTSSNLCLNELSKIVECRKNDQKQQTVLPIFCDVRPSEVREQLPEKPNREALISKYDQVLVDKWSESQTVVCNISGWDLGNSDYAKTIHQIVEHISSLLDSRSLGYDNDYIGMDSRVKKMMAYLDKDPDEVRTIAIWGPGGIGKTTIAEEVFKKLKDQFEYRALFSNVSIECEEHAGVTHLQECLYRILFNDEKKIQYDAMGTDLLRRRLCSRKTLIILDDVTTLNQIEALVGKAEQQHNMFGQGSRIILTSRDKVVLRSYCGNNNICDVEKLSDSEALQLFFRYAFNEQNPPSNELKIISKDVVQFADALPLALKILGSLLCGESENVWSDVQNYLKVSSGKSKKNNIYNILRLGYDKLQDDFQQIFLDIACFFKGEAEYHVRKILESSDFYPTIGIKVLIDKALITIQGGKIWMHHLLQEIGWSIVQEESPNKPWKRSRLWLYPDACDVLLENKGKTKVQGMFLRAPAKDQLDLNSDPFVNMGNLRILKICNVNLPGYLKYDLLTELGLLEWHGYPLNSMPPNLQPHKLVELSMPKSCIEQLWNETKHCPKLILMDLSNCHNLIKSPNFDQTPNLEKLILEGCRRLSNIHPSIGDLEHLLLLNLRECQSLIGLPSRIRMKSLKTLILSGCSTLEEFPENVEDMGNLSELFLDGTAISKLPISIKQMVGLNLLNLSNCNKLLSLQSEIIRHLTSLQHLSLSGCSSIEQLPEDLGNLKHLEKLFVDGTCVKKVPSCIQLLKKLKFLSFRGCKGLQSLDPFSGLCSLISLDLSQCDLPDGAIPDDIGHRLSSLEVLDLSENNFKSIPESISRLSKLRELSISKCKNLKSLPKNLPLCLTHVNARDCPELGPDGLEIWSSNAKGFHFIDFSKSSGSGEDSTRLTPLPMSEDHVDTLFPEFIKGLINDEKLFDIHFPYKMIPQWCSMWSSGASVTTKLSPENNFRARKGIVLFVVVKIEKREHLEESVKGKRTFVNFQADGVDIESLLFFQNIEYLKEGSFAICSYIPRQRSRELDPATRSIGASFSSTPDVQIEMCGIRVIFEGDHVETFSQELSQTANEHLELVLNFCRHCKILLDESNRLESTGDVISVPCDDPLVSTSMDSLPEERNQSSTLISIPIDPLEVPSISGDTSSALVQNIQSDLSQLFQGHSASKRMFAFTVCRRLISPWFFHHSMGDIAVCYLPPNLYDDETWLGLELYVTFKLSPGSKESKTSTALYVYLYGHGLTIFPILRSENYSVSGSSGLAVVIFFHIPRDFFSEQLNQCQCISVFFRFTNPDVSVEICGMRLLFERDTEILIQAIIESAKVAQDGLPFLHAQAKAYLQPEGPRPSYVSLCSSNTYLREEIVSFQKLLTGTGGDAKEISTKIQKYRTYVANKMGYKEFDPIIVHSKSYFWDMWKSHSQKRSACSTATDFNHLHVMAETLGNLSDSGYWKENLEFALQEFSKFMMLVTLTVRGHLISTIRHFDPWATYNLCFPPHNEVLPCFDDEQTIFSSGSRVRIELPSNLCSDNNWKGLVICAELSVHEHPTAFSEMALKLLCHFTSNGRCLNPVSMYSVTKEEFKWLYLRRFIWLTYVPSSFLTQLNGEEHVEAKIYNDSIGLIVENCRIRLLYQEDVAKFNKTIIKCCTSFFDYLDRIDHFLARQSTESQCIDAESGETISTATTSGTFDGNTATLDEDDHSEEIIHGTTLDEDLTIVPSTQGGFSNEGISHRGIVETTTEGGQDLDS